MPSWVLFSASSPLAETGRARLLFSSVRPGGLERRQVAAASAQWAGQCCDSDDERQQVVTQTTVQREQQATATQRQGKEWAEQGDEGQVEE